MNYREPPYLVSWWNQYSVRYDLPLNFHPVPIAHAAIKEFDMAFLHQLAGRDVVPFHLMFFASAKDHVRGELGAVAGHDASRARELYCYGSSRRQLWHHAVWKGVSI